MLTLRQSIEAFLLRSEEQGHSKKVLTVMAGVLKKQLLWEVFCLLPGRDYPPSYEAVRAQEGKSGDTLHVYSVHWGRFRQFLESSKIHFLSMGDAANAFLSACEQEGYASQTVLIARSCVKLLGREFAGNLSLSAMEGRIATTIWQSANKSGSKYFRYYIIRFFRYLQEERLLKQPLFRRSLPKWKQEVERLMKTDGQDLNPGSPFSACLGPYFSHCINAKNMTDQGLQSQYHQLTRFSRWLGEVSLGAVDLDQVERYLIYRQEECHNRLATLKSITVHLKSLFHFLYQEGILPDNPLTTLRVKQPPKFSRTVLTSEELKRLLEAARSLDRTTNGGTTKRIQTFLAARDAAILELLVHTGIRSNELRTLTLQKLNLKRGYLEISGKGSNKHYKKERRVFLEGEHVYRALAEYLAVRPAEFGALLFTTKNGNPLKTGDLCKILARSMAAAGINKTITPHSLRASFASVLVAGGVDPLTLKTLMGHESLHTTLQSYVSLEQDQLREVWKTSNPLAHLPTRKGGPSE